MNKSDRFRFEFLGKFIWKCLWILIDWCTADLSIEFGRKYSAFFLLADERIHSCDLDLFIFILEYNLLKKVYGC